MSTIIDAPGVAPPTEQPRPVVPQLLEQLYLCLGVVAFWALTLRNTIFIDEAVYIMAGRAQINHWVSGTPLPANLGEGFSGSPVIYPVIAGALDMVGGLELVRLFSLACMLATMLIVRALTIRLFNRRAGLVAAAIFGFTASVLYVGHIGTFDAMVILLLAIAVYIGVTRQTWRSGVAVAVVMAFAVATKYTAYIFVPAVLGVMLFDTYLLSMSSTLRQWRGRFTNSERIFRAWATFCMTVLLLGLGYGFFGEAIHDALMFTTLGRSALSPVSATYLLGRIPLYLWPMLLTFGMGVTFLAVARRWNAVLYSLGLLASAMVLPAGQIILGESVSFEKHLAYSALFLAPIAGWGLARPWRLSIWTPLLTVYLIIACMWGAGMSHDMIQYPNVSTVVTTLKDAPRGEYLSSSADSLRYYTRDDQQIQWVATFALYGNDAYPERIIDPIVQGRFQKVIIHAGRTGSAISDTGQKVLLEALDMSPQYHRTTLDGGTWLVYTKRPI